MPRAEVGTQKWLANKMKAKGLQKLRWYCQMCEKQCRDENGFKCHRMSEGHQRQMQLFCQNPDRFMDEFSHDFERSFMRLMKTRYCRTRVLANTVYNEMIADKLHIHMNSTIWVTLSEFIMYLGQSGKCKIDHTPKGWFIEYIDRERIERERNLASRMKQEARQERVDEKHIESLIEAARIRGTYDTVTESTPLQRSEQNGEKIYLKFNEKPSSSSQTPNSTARNALIDGFLEKKALSTKSESQAPAVASKNKRLSALDRMMIKGQHEKKRKTLLKEEVEDISEKNDVKKEADLCKSSDISADSFGLKNKNNFKEEILVKKQEGSASKDSEKWISKGLVVKILSHEQGSYYGKKGVVCDTFLNKEKKYSAAIRLLEDIKPEEKAAISNGTVDNLKALNLIEMKQEDVDTVIPKAGGIVRILFGRYKGREGILEEVDYEGGTVCLEETVGKPKILKDLHFEEFCKVLQ